MEEERKTALRDRLKRVRGSLAEVRAAGMFEKPAKVELAAYEMTGLLSELVDEATGDTK